MRSVNKVIIVGNLTRDPELRQTPNGQAVTTFGLATNREWITKDGRKMNSAEFHECVTWARLAEISAQYLKKGKLIYVEGYLKTRSWDTPEGVKKFRTEIIVQDMIMLEKREGGGDYVPSDQEMSEGSQGGHDEHGSHHDRGGNGRSGGHHNTNEFTPLAPLIDDEQQRVPETANEPKEERRKPMPSVDPGSISIEGDLGV